MKTSFAFTRPARTLAPLALAAALTGCSMAPKYDRPAAPIDTAYPLGAAYVEPAAATPDDAITAEIGWRDFFRDPLLQQLIGISLENNRDMRKAALNVEAAQALYRIQRAEMLPNLGVSARGASERVPADLSTTGQSDVLRRRRGRGDGRLGTGPVGPHPQPQRPGAGVLPGPRRDPHRHADEPGVRGGQRLPRCVPTRNCCA